MSSKRMIRLCARAIFEKVLPKNKKLNLHSQCKEKESLVGGTTKKAKSNTRNSKASSSDAPLNKN
jgi:hypothetical protein